MIPLHKAYTLFYTISYQYPYQETGPNMANTWPHKAGPGLAKRRCPRSASSCINAACGPNYASTTRGAVLRHPGLYSVLLKSCFHYIRLIPYIIRYYRSEGFPRTGYFIPGRDGTKAWRISGVVRMTARACLLFL